MFFYQNNFNKMKHLKELKINEDFFDSHEDTAIDGFRMEIAIDELIEDAKESIMKTFPGNKPDDINIRNDARIAIKKLWMEKIKQWKDEIFSNT